MPKIVYTGEETDGWQPLPKGTYKFQIDDVEMTTSSKDNQQLKVMMHVVDGPHDGKKATDWYVLVPKAMWRIESLLDASGIDYEHSEAGVSQETGKPMHTFEFDYDDLIGTMIVADVETGEYNGKPKNNFTEVRAPDDGTQQQPPGAPAAAPAPAPAPQPQQQAAPAPQPGTQRRRRRVQQ